MSRPVSERIMFKTVFFRIVFLMLAAAALAGCVKNEVKVEVNLPESVSDTYRILYYASDPVKGWVIENVLQVEKGKGELLLQTRNPTIVYVFAEGRLPATFFYAERGDKITIDGQDGRPASWTIGGNKINEQLSEWRKANRAVLTANRPGENSSALDKAVTAYVDKNPDNPVATLLLLEYYNRGGDELGFLKEWKKLRGEALDGRWRELVSRSDMLEEPSAHELPKMLVFNSVGTGCDTISFGAKPVLLYFSKPGLDDYRSKAQELRSISRESGDSSGRVIANVLFEPDSTQRWQAARRDSLQNVVEAWVPLGISDAQMRQLGVMRVPYAIVVDSAGKIIYRGEDLERAGKDFNRLLKK